MATSLALATRIALSAVPPSANEDRPKRVLLINSYHPGYSWSDNVERGVRSRLASSGKKLELSVEYLDTRRFPNPALLSNLAEHFSQKYALYPLDVIILSDNAAFDFAVAYRERLFPSVPVVFCGYNNFRPELLARLPNATGINEEVDLPATVELAIKTYPKTSTLLFITSTADASSRRISEIAEDTVFPRYRAVYDLVILKDASLREIRQRLAELPSTSLVFLSGQTSELSFERPTTPEENGRLIAAASPFPVYTFWEFHLGTGVLGGHILRGDDQGQYAADYALRILHGSPPSAIPVLMRSPSRNVFDYNAMQRFALSSDALPHDSIVINRPDSVWHAHRGQIALAALALALETSLIAALLAVVRQRNRALVALASERSSLEARVVDRTRELKAGSRELELAVASRDTLLSNALVTITLVRNRHFVWASSHISEMLGYTPAEIVGQATDMIYVHPTDALKVGVESPDSLARGEAYQADYELRRKDGSKLWCTISGKAIDPHNLSKGILYVAVDIDARKAAERALLDVNQRLERLATTDPLTQLTNRRKLLEILDQEVSRSKRYHSPLSVIMVDIDHFKSVNDMHGHDIGDAVLREAAAILASSSRETDVVGRLGGEEFLVLCTQTDVSGAMKKAELLRTSLEQHTFPTVGQVTASFGVDSYVPGDSSNTLLRRVDLALYEAKLSRNCVCRSGS